MALMTKPDQPAVDVGLAGEGRHPAVLSLDRGRWAWVSRCASLMERQQCPLEAWIKGYPLIKLVNIVLCTY